MKKKSCFMIYLLLFFALIALSITTTLALIRDSESKTGNILQFEKVSLMGDSENGSHLSLKLDKENVGLGQDVIGGIDGGEPLLIRPTNDTVEMYIRFRIYFTLENEDLNAQYAEALSALNNKGENGVLSGLILKESTEYKFSAHEDWVYITIIDGTKTNLLKVITSDYNTNGITICEEYKLNYDITKEHLIMELQENVDVFLKVEVQAIQCLNLSKVADEENSSNSILTSGSNEDLEEKFNFATIEDFAQAMYENSIANIGDGTKEFPYILSSTESFERVLENVNNGYTYENEYFVLGNNIEFTSTNTTIGAFYKRFRGSIDGKNHKIIGLQNPLFHYLENNEYIKDIIFDNCSTNMSADDAGVLTRITANSNISNVRFYNCTINSNKNNVGLIAGQSMGSRIRNCESATSNTITCGKYNVGGLIGYLFSNSLVEYCTNSATVNGGYCTGGIVGINYSSTIQYCKNKGTINVSQNCGAGIVGADHENAVLQYCCNYGDVNGVYGISDNRNKATAGIIGYTDSAKAIIKCYNVGNFNYDDSKINNYCYVAGIIGQVNNSSKNIKYCYSVSNMVAKNCKTLWIGGIIADVVRVGSVTNCYDMHSHSITSYSYVNHGNTPNVVSLGGKTNNYIYGHNTSGRSIANNESLCKIPTLEDLGEGFKIDKSKNNGNPILFWE